MNIITRGFRGRRQDGGRQLPPGQYLTRVSGVVCRANASHSAGRLGIHCDDKQGDRHRWSGTELMGLAAESITQTFTA